jgi:diguanylate cyclase (GGDEF)-like protein
MRSQPDDMVTIDVDPCPQLQPRRNNFALHVVRGPRAGEVLVVESDCLLGRGDDVQLHIPDPTLSRQHVKFERNGATLTVTDLGSRNGTFIEGQRLQGKQVLENGALIAVGKVVLRFAIQDVTEIDASRALYAAAVRDRLTHLYNRGFFDDRLEVEFKYNTRHKMAMTLIMIDLDHFKQINDQHGHPAGDAVLRATAEALLRSVRAEDVVARHGGEEFVVLARGTNEEGARILAQRLRTRISALQIAAGKTVVRVTASLGVAIQSPETMYRSPAELVAAADEALYAAKHEGRDRVVVHASRSQPTQDCDTARRLLLRSVKR